MDDENLETSVLIVDDSALNIKVVSNIIAPHGYKVRVAKSGVQALKLLSKFQPTIILMDIQMPEMNGFECCLRIKKNTNLARIPMIFLSGSHDEKDKEKALAMGAKAYMTKPLDADELLKLLELHAPWVSAIA